MRRLLPPNNLLCDGLFLFLLLLLLQLLLPLLPGVASDLSRVVFCCRFHKSSWCPFAVCVSGDALRCSATQNMTSRSIAEGVWSHGQPLGHGGQHPARRRLVGTTRGNQLNAWRRPRVGCRHGEQRGDVRRGTSRCCGTHNCRCEFDGSLRTLGV